MAYATPEARKRAWELWYYHKGGKEREREYRSNLKKQGIKRKRSWKPSPEQKERYRLKYKEYWENGGMERRRERRMQNVDKYRADYKEYWARVGSARRRERRAKATEQGEQS